jgi:hypothetical protein
MKSMAIALLGVAVLAGCESNQQYLAGSQAAAVQTAVTRARFELDCPEAIGSVLSSEVVQPAFVGPRMMGVPRAEYTVGVEGCGRRATYVVLCPDGGGGCFAGNGERLGG